LGLNKALDITNREVKGKGGEGVVAKSDNSRHGAF